VPRTRNPRVLFIDGDMWEPFGQLAAALALHGVASDHLTVPPRHLPGRYSHLLERRLFHHTEAAVLRSGTVSGAAWVNPDRVSELTTSDTVDVQARDDLGYQLLQEGDAEVPPLQHATALANPAAIYDKWHMTHFAQHHGVSTPHTWRPDDTDTSDSIRKILDNAVFGPGGASSGARGTAAGGVGAGAGGTATGGTAAGSAAARDPGPDDASVLVVKAPVGFGGQGVALAHGADQVAGHLRQLRAFPGGEPFLQEYVGTRMVNVGGVAADGEVLLSASYRPIPPIDDPLGPPAAIELIEHQHAISATHRLIEATGFHGIFTLDYVLNSHDEVLFIDFNPRVFGAWAPLQSLGVDILGAYLQLLGIGVGPIPTPTLSGQRARTLSPPPDSGPLRPWWNTSVATISRWQPWLGSKWARQARARMAAYAMRRTAQRALPHHDS
jgi:hypothetical protein